MGIQGVYSGYTRVYMGILGYTRVYMGILGYTRVSKSIQWVYSGYICCGLNLVLVQNF